MVRKGPEKNNRNKQSIGSLTDQIDKELDRIQKQGQKERENIALANKKEREKLSALEQNAEKIWNLAFDQADKKKPGVVLKFANKLGIYIHVEKTVPYPGSSLQGRNLYIVHKGKKLPVKAFYANKTDRLGKLKTPRRVISEIVNTLILVAAKNGLLQVLNNKKRREISAELNSPYIRQYLSRIQLQFALEMLNNPVGRPGQRPARRPSGRPSRRSSYRDRINNLRREARTSPTKNKELRKKCLTPYTDPITKQKGQQFTARGSYRNARLSELYPGSAGKIIWIKKAANLNSKDAADYMKLKLGSDGEYHATNEADREVHEHGWNRMPVKRNDVVFDKDPIPYLKRQDESINERTQREVRQALANFAKKKLSIESVTTLLRVLNIQKPKITLETIGKFRRLNSQGVLQMLGKKIKLELQGRTNIKKEALLKLFMITYVHAAIHIKNVLEDLRKRFNGLNFNGKEINLTDKKFSAYKTINGTKYTFNFAFTIGKTPTVTLKSITKETAGKQATKVTPRMAGYLFFRLGNKNALSSYLKKFFAGQPLTPTPSRPSVTPQPTRPNPGPRPPSNTAPPRPNQPNPQPTPGTPNPTPAQPNRPQQAIRPAETLKKFSEREITAFINKFNALLNPKIRSRSKSLRLQVDKLRMHVNRNNFRIEKAASGEHRILLNAVSINGTINNRQFKNFKVNIFPLVIGLKKGGHTFEMSKHVVYAISEIRKRIVLSGLTAYLRNSIERHPKNDADLKQLKLSRMGTLTYKGQPVYSASNPVSPARFLGIMNKKMKFLKRGGKIIVAYNMKSFRFGMSSAEISGEIEIVKKNGKYLAKYTHDTMSQYVLSQRAFENGGYDNTIKDILRMYTMAADAMPGHLLRHSTSLERKIIQNVHQFAGYLREKPKSFAGLLVLTRFFHSLHSLKDVQNMHPASYKNIAKLINETGGFHKMVGVLAGMFSIDVIMNLAKNPKNINRYIKTWKFITQNKDIAGYKEGKGESYINIKFLARHKNIQKVMTKIIAERKRRGIRKKLHYINDRSLIIDITEKYNQTNNPDIKTLYQSAIEKIKNEEKTDPLALAPRQKMRVISLIDSSIADPPNDFYFRNALEAMYPGKIAGYHTHGAYKPAKRMGFPAEAIQKAKVVAQIKQAMKNGEKLFIYINAHGAENTGTTSIGNMANLITSAIKTMPPAKRREFIARNLIIGTGQCYGGLLLNIFKNKLGMRPKFMFSETDGQDLNAIYRDPHHKIGLGAKLMRSYYDAAMEYKKKGYWTKVNGTIVRKKPTLTRMLQYLDEREKTMDARMYLRTDAASNPVSPPQAVQPNPVPPRPTPSPNPQPAAPTGILRTTPAQFNRLPNNKQREMIEALGTFAETYMKQKQYALALKHFDKILALDTKNTLKAHEKRALNFMRGICLLHIRKLTAADMAFLSPYGARNRAERIEIKKQARKYALEIMKAGDALMKGRKYQKAFNEYQKLMILNRFGIFRGKEYEKTIAKMKECRNKMGRKTFALKGFPEIKDQSHFNQLVKNFSGTTIVIMSPETWKCKACNRLKSKLSTYYQAIGKMPKNLRIVVVKNDALSRKIAGRLNAYPTTVIYHNKRKQPGAFVSDNNFAITDTANKYLNKRSARPKRITLRPRSLSGKPATKKSADQLFKNKRYNDAIKQYESLITSGGLNKFNKMLVQVNLSLAYLYTNKGNKCIQVLKNIDRGVRALTNSLFEKGLSQYRKAAIKKMNTGKINEAMKDLEKLVLIEKKVTYLKGISSDSMLALNICRVILGRYKEAANDANKSKTGKLDSTLIRFLIHYSSKDPVKTMKLLTFKSLKKLPPLINMMLLSNMMKKSLGYLSKNYPKLKKYLEASTKVHVYNERKRLNDIIKELLRIGTPHYINEFKKAIPPLKLAKKLYKAYIQKAPNYWFHPFFKQDAQKKIKFIDETLAKAKRKLQGKPQYLRILNS